MWQLASMIAAFERLWQEDLKFEAHLGYIASNGRSMVSYINQ
jgi:hypothetical protein